MGLSTVISAILRIYEDKCSKKDVGTGQGNKHIHMHQYTLTLHKHTLFSLSRSLRPMYKRVLSHREITHMHTWRCEEPQSQSVHTHVLAALLSRSCTRFVRGISTEIDRSQIPKDKSSRLSPTLCADCPGLS